MQYTKLRGMIFIGWAVCILIAILAHAVAFFYAPIKPDAGKLMISMGTIIGLLAPHLTLIYEFFLVDQPTTNKKLDSTVAYTMLFMCVLYWIVFCAAVWLGVVERSFSNEATGKGLENNAAIIVAIAGTLSFLAIKPTLKLFVLMQK